MYAGRSYTFHKRISMRTRGGNVETRISHWHDAQVHRLPRLNRAQNPDVAFGHDDVTRNILRYPP